MRESFNQIKLKITKKSCKIQPNGKKTIKQKKIYFFFLFNNQFNLVQACH